MIYLHHTMGKHNHISGLGGAISQILTARREQKRLTQAKMADELKITRRTYQRYELGSMSGDELEIVLRYLELKLIILPKELIDSQ